jgi:hypothetical protein
LGCSGGRASGLEDTCAVRGCGHIGDPKLGAGKTALDAVVERRSGALTDQHALDWPGGAIFSICRWTGKVRPVLWSALLAREIIS